MAAYRKAALRVHPDKVQGDEDAKEEAKQKFIRLQEAYDVLSGAVRRQRKCGSCSDADAADYRAFYRGRGEVLTSVCAWGADPDKRALYDEQGSDAVDGSQRPGQGGFHQQRQQGHPGGGFGGGGGGFPGGFPGGGGGSFNFGGGFPGFNFGGGGGGGHPHAPPPDPFAGTPLTRVTGANMAEVKSKGCVRAHRCHGCCCCCRDPLRALPLPHAARVPSGLSCFTSRATRACRSWCRG